MRVHGWSRWQTYRRDRASPPWIKVHRRIFADPNWARLSDAQKGQLVSLWVLAADRDGRLDDDPRVLRRMAGLDELDVDILTQLGFLEPDKPTSKRRQRDANVTPSRRQHDEAEAEAETETETETEAPPVAPPTKLVPPREGNPTEPPPVGGAGALTHTGPNRPTRKQREHLESLAQALERAPPEPRSKAEASRLIDELTAEREFQRAGRLEQAREAGRLEGKIQGRRMQADSAVDRAVETMKRRRQK